MSVNPSRSAHLVPLIAIQVVGLVCGVIGVRWSSALVPPEILGIFGLLISTQLFGTAVTHQGFIQHVQRFWTPITAGPNYVRLLIAASSQPWLWLGLGLALILALLKLTTGSALSSGWWFWIFAVNGLLVIAQLVHAALQAEERYWAHFSLSVVSIVTRSFIPLLLATMGTATLIVLSTGFLIHTMIWAVVGAWILSRPWGGSRTGADTVMEPPEKMIGTFVGVGLCGWLAGSAPRWFAAAALTPQTTGFFILATNLSMIVPAAVSLVGQSYSFPPLFAAARAGASAAALSRMTLRTVATVLLVGQGGLLLLAAIAPHLVGLIVHERYAPAMNWLLAAGGAVLASVTASFFCNFLIARHRERACFPLSATSAAFRLAVMGALAFAGSAETFRLGLALLPWPTVVLEWALARHFASRES